MVVELELGCLGHAAAHAEERERQHEGFVVALWHDFKGLNGFGLNWAQIKWVHRDLGHHHCGIGRMRIVLRRKRDIRIRVRLAWVGKLRWRVLGVLWRILILRILSVLWRILLELGIDFLRIDRGLAACLDGAGKDAGLDRQLLD